MTSECTNNLLHPIDVATVFSYVRKLLYVNIFSSEDVSDTESSHGMLAMDSDGTYACTCTCSCSMYRVHIHVYEVFCTGKQFLLTNKN